ncbi:CYIR protein [Plasmodium cynomolgi strain B]|uniref:CYIR protein n=1 Tax=Plasmodium cynomolgi (strain B) TaxID=1120755 RepID=K6UFB6_PLACD|nr:CYIR protein [Plasmodium cynomolgi strain B]GAB69816.1 CYIR protein [Plasmodium cynomolgi strain B]
MLNTVAKDRIIKALSEWTEICKRILRYLDKNSLSHNPDTEYDGCILLNYWVYSRLFDIFGSDAPGVIYSPFAALQRIWHDFIENRQNRSLHKKCLPHSATITKRDWKKRKHLYDYYVDYDYLLGMAQNFITNECTNYENFKKMFLLYKSFEEVCENGTDNCPKVFHKFKEKNIESAIKKLTCDAKIIGTSGPTSEEISSLQVKSSTDVHPETEEDLVLDLRDVFTIESDTHLDSENSGIGSKVTHSILGAAPVLLTGPWIRGLVGGRTNSKNTMDVFSPYTQETSDMFLMTQQTIYLINQ